MYYPEGCGTDGDYGRSDGYRGGFDAYGSGFAVVDGDLVVYGSRMQAVENVLEVAAVRVVVVNCGLTV